MIYAHDLSYFLPGDRVTLKPGPYVVSGVKDRDWLYIKVGPYTYKASRNLIDSHTPKSRVTDEMVEAALEVVLLNIPSPDSIRQALEAAEAVRVAQDKEA